MIYDFPNQEPEVLEFRRKYCRECGKKCDYPSFKMFACLLAKIADQEKTEKKKIDYNIGENEKQGRVINDAQTTNED